MIILGIDPGNAITGYAAVEYDSNSSRLIKFGSIITDKKDKDSKRLFELYNDLCTVIETIKPDVASVEKLFFFKNQKTVIPVAQARGVILAALEKYSIPIFEYTPMEVKLSVTGYGRSTKDEVAALTKKLVEYKKFPKLDDTADAVAIALCHTRTGILR